MAELLRLAIDLVTALSPLKIVWAWQSGLYFVAGRLQWVVKPGVWPVVPGLCDVRTVNVVPEIETTPLQSITLRDGTGLTYSASLTVRVVDAAAAYCMVGHHSETIVELAARVISDGLADADPARFDPARGKRDRLLEEIRGEINAAAASYGVVVESLGLNNFVRGVRTVRLLTDAAVIGGRGKL